MEPPFILFQLKIALEVGLQLIHPDFCKWLFSALYAMMKVNDDSVEWAIPDPVKFINDNLTECIRMLVSTIKENDYNPQTVGKSTGAHEGMKLNYQLQLTKI